MFWQSTLAGANLVIRTIVLIVLARQLPPSAFGIVAAALVVTSITQVVSQIGVTQALVQRLDVTDDHFRSGFALSLYLGAAAAALLLLGASQIAALFRIPDMAPIIQAFSVLLLLNGISAVPIAALQRRRRFKILSSIELIAFCSGYGAVGLLLTFAGFGVWALAFAQITQVSTRTVLYLAVARPPIGLKLRRGALSDLAQAGSGFSVGQVGNLIATQVDYFIVGRLLGAEQLGLYSRAYQFLMLPAQLLGTATATVLFPSIASIQDQPQRVARAYLRAVGMIAMITLPLSGVLIVVAPELVAVVLGPNWAGMVVPFQILIATLLFRVSYKVSDSLALAMGSMYRRAWRQWIYAAGVAGGALVGSAWGLAGVSAGVGLAVVLNFLMMLHLALRLSGISAYQVATVHARHTVAAVPIVFLAALVAVLARAAALSDATVLAVTGATAAMIAGVMWARYRAIFGEDGEWAHALAVHRLAPWHARLRSWTAF